MTAAIADANVIFIEVIMSSFLFIKVLMEIILISRFELRVVDTSGKQDL